MAYTPSGQITLCRVPFGSDMKHTRYFTSTTAQRNYFSPKYDTAGVDISPTAPHLSSDNYTFIRKNNVIKIPYHIDQVRKYNYVYYKNAGSPDTNFMGKYFYNFIVDYEYVNENTTALHVVQDDFQTWMFSISFDECYVEREHVNSDAIGGNLTEEDIPVNNYIQVHNTPYEFPNFNYIYITSYVTFSGLVISSGDLDERLNGDLQQYADGYVSSGQVYKNADGKYVWSVGSESGVLWSPSYAEPVEILGIVRPYYILRIATSDGTKRISLLKNFIRLCNGFGVTDSIVSIIAGPPEIGRGITWSGQISDVSSARASFLERATGDSGEPVTSTFSDSGSYAIDGAYTPRNNKMYNYPFCYYSLETPEGMQVYKPEYFRTGSHKPFFDVQTSFDDEPQMVLTPYAYAINGALTTNPQSSTNNNSVAVKLRPAIDIPWRYDQAAITKALNMNRNQAELSNASRTFSTRLVSDITTTAIDTVTGMLAPVTAYHASGGALNPLAGAIASSKLIGGINNVTHDIINTARDITSSKNETSVIEAKIADRSNLPVTQGGTSTTATWYVSNDMPLVNLKYYTITAEIAGKIDNYLSVYGYKVATFKKPNLTGRARWNYVQTVDCAISPVNTLNSDIPPSTDIENIKRIFNNGITLWHDDNVEQYGSFANSII